jgi:hypothetical protein
MATTYELYQLLRQEFNAAAARTLATAIWEHDRMMTTQSFRQSARLCASAMAEAGLSAVRVEAFPADGRTAFEDIVAPKAWDCRSAELIISGNGKRERMCSYPDEPLSVAMGCGRTRKRGVEGEVVWWGQDARPAGRQRRSWRGKFVLSDELADKIAPEAVKRGALGVISCAMPTFPPARREPWDNADGRSWQRVDPSKRWVAFVLTPRQGEELRRRLQAAPGGNPVRAHARVDSRAYDGEIPAVTGLVPGRRRKEIAIIAHLFEPGANDNASGAACAIELARTIVRLVGEKRLPTLNLGIRILLPMEFTTTLAFFDRHPQIRRDAVAGIVPDMVGNDQALCRSALHCQTTPDAAPSFINHVMSDALEGVRDAFARPVRPDREPYWLAVERGYWGNDCFVSDPTIGIPTIGLIEWPDRFYHSSADTPDKLSETTLARSGALVGAIALVAATVDETGAAQLCYRIAGRGIAELERSALPFFAELGAGTPGSGDLPASRLDRRLRHLVARERGALESVSELLPGGNVPRLKRLIGSLGSDLERAAESLGERFRREAGRTAPEARRRPSAAERRAAEAIPRRTVMGPVRLRRLDARAKRRLERIQKRGVPTNLLLWIDGKRTVAEIIERCMGEGAKPDLRSVLAYLDLLADHGYVEWRQ